MWTRHAGMFCSGNVCISRPFILVNVLSFVYKHNRRIKVRQMVSGKKKGGRPLKHPGEPLSKAMAFRLRPRLAELLQDAAEKASRTVSQEIEHRLEKSFQDERIAQAHFGSDVGAELLRMFYSAMVLEGVHPDWSGDRDRAENFRVSMNAIIAVMTGLPLEFPLPQERWEGLQTAREFLLKSSKRGAIPAEIMAASDPAAYEWYMEFEEKEKRPRTSKRKAGA